MTTEIALDEHGRPILLDAAVRQIPVESGNPLRAPAGRFGSRVGGRSAVPDLHGSGRPPTGIPEDEWARRLDAVREAAREFESFNEQDITEWLKGKTNKELTAAEIKAFLSDVRSQQLADLVDILDQAERGKKRGRRFVRVSAPRGYTRKTLNALDDVELQDLARRLRARGWADSEMKSLVSRLPHQRRQVVEGL